MLYQKKLSQGRESNLIYSIYLVIDIANGEENEKENTIRRPTGILCGTDEIIKKCDE
jgi:hypothetical protein